MSEYQQLLDEIPDDWKIIAISKLGKVVSGGTPARDVPAFWGGDTPWITPGDISKLRDKFVHKTSENITKHGLNSSGANLLPENSLLVTSRATLGAKVVNAVPIATNQGFKSIIFHQVKDADFYYHFFDKVIGEMERRASGTTFLEISGAEFSSIPLPSPSDEEKKTIANILDTLDTQIRQTEAIIAKLQQVKQGLLHDLLTRGIDASGQLRPSCDQTPELYKETSLGWIPKEWELKPLSSFLTRTTYGFTNPMPTTEDGPWMVTAADVSEGSINYTTARQTSWRAFDMLTEKSKPRVGDILITKDGTLGRVALVDNKNICINQSVAVMQPLPGTDTDYIQTYLRSPIGQTRMLEDAGGSTIKHLYITVLEKMLLPLPHSEEAAKICYASNSLNSRLKDEHEKLQKLKKQKLGLMDDLLTGRVRVTDLIGQQRAS